MPAAAAAGGVDRASVGEDEPDFARFEGGGGARAGPGPVSRTVPRFRADRSEEKRKRACAGRPVVPCPACGSREAVLCTRSSFPCADQQICGRENRLFFCQANKESCGDREEKCGQS